MSKKVEVKILEYLPKLQRSSTWEDAWNMVADANPNIEGAFVVSKGVATFTLYNRDEVVTEFTRPENEVIDKDTTINFDPFIKEAFEYMIKYKMIRKPGTKVLEGLADLKRQRDNLTMRINSWKKAGKDTTELEKQKEILTKAIKG